MSKVINLSSQFFLIYGDPGARYFGSLKKFAVRALVSISPFRGKDNIYIQPQLKAKLPLINLILKSNNNFVFHKCDFWGKS